jgi:hypothetical protein
MKKSKRNKEFDDRYWKELEHKLTCNLISNLLCDLGNIYHVAEHSKDYAKTANRIATNVINYLKNNT